MKEKQLSIRLLCTNTSQGPDYRPTSHKPTQTLYSRSHDSVLTGARLNSSHIVYQIVSPVWPIACTLFGAKWAPMKTLLKNSSQQGLEGHCPLCSPFTPSTQMDLDIYFSGGTINDTQSRIFLSLTLKKHFFLIFKSISTHKPQNLVCNTHS